MQENISNVDKIIEVLEDRESLIFYVQKGLWCFLPCNSIYNNFVVVEFEDTGFSKISFIEAYYDNRYSSTFKVSENSELPERLAKSIRYNSNRAIYIEKL